MASKVFVLGRALALALLAALLLSCGDTPKTAESVKKEVAKPEPVEPVSGRSAFYKIYPQARSWAVDSEVLQLMSIPMDDVPVQPGKAGAWQATFVSRSLGRSRSYTYSVIEGPGNLHKGVFAGLESPWSGPRGQVRPFPIQAFKIDSTEALDEAMKNSGAQGYSKKNPDMPMTYLLEATSRHPNAAWRVLWGISVAKSNFSIYVDASTGKYLETMR